MSETLAVALSLLTICAAGDVLASRTVIERVKYPIAYETRFDQPWSDGMSVIVPFEANGQPQYLYYRPKFGTVGVDAIASDGRTVTNVWKSSWRTNYSIFSVVPKDGAPHLLWYRNDTGEVGFEHLTPEGARTVWTSHWWGLVTNLVTFKTGGRAYYLALDGSGQVSMDEITSTGLTAVYRSRWPSGWTLSPVFYSGANPRYVAYSQDTGEMTIDEVVLDADQRPISLRLVASTNVGHGWTQVAPIRADGLQLVLLYAQDTGRYQYRYLEGTRPLDATLTGTWGPGWTTFTPFDLGGQTYLMSVMASSHRSSIVCGAGLTPDATFDPIAPPYSSSEVNTYISHFGFDETDWNEGFGWNQAGDIAKPFARALMGYHFLKKIGQAVRAVTPYGTAVGAYNYVNQYIDDTDPTCDAGSTLADYALYHVDVHRGFLYRSSPGERAAILVHEARHHGGPHVTCNGGDFYDLGDWGCDASYAEDMPYGREVRYIKQLWENRYNLYPSQVLDDKFTVTTAMYNRLRDRANAVLGSKFNTKPGFSL